MTLEKKIFDACLWLTAACLLMAFLTSCSPYAANVSERTQTPTPSQAATATGTIVPKSPTPRPSCTVTAYTLNMRTAGSMSARVIQILEHGEALTVIARGDWLKVRTPQRVTGWVYGKYCK
jgi:uncharacterized protein YgiM (DUF1202 family)